MLEQRRRERRGEIDAEHVVPAVMIASGQRGFLAARLGARLAPAVVAVAGEEPVIRAEVVVDANDARRVGIEAGVVAREEIVALRIGVGVGRTMYCSSVRATGSMRLAGIVLFGNGCGTPLMVFSGS